ncbi:hypothetical protein BY458DRAFT_500100 [Sporodiniella umbellata]|nr:hypothetical protein BY458DRAFT_500100 [Sporodiniella umbellata]
MQRISKSFNTKMGSKLGFHTSASSLAISRFNLPAMSPTMTEGTIHQWKKKEGESFSAGEVLLELETDKAQIDVEAADDGVLAKIILQDGSKAPVNTLIALLAEEGDDISSVDIPKESQGKEAVQASESSKSMEEPAQESKGSAKSHVEVDTQALKKPLSPAVLSLVLKHGIQDVASIEGSGYGGRILKGDVLAHLGLIAPKPAPARNLTAAPPREAIVFAKTEKAAEEKQAPKALPTFISKQVMADALFDLRGSPNEQQHRTQLSINALIAKAAERALQDVQGQQKSRSSVMYALRETDVVENTRYAGGEFKVFDLAEPNYDFITDRMTPSKPYMLTVSVGPKQTVQAKPRSQDQEMMDLIGYLGGQEQTKESQVIGWTTGEGQSNRQENSRRFPLAFKLDGGVPGKILHDKQATAFLDRIEYYISRPNELVD